MKILFAASENAWGGFLGRIRTEFPDCTFVHTGGFHIDTLQGFDVLIPTMCPVGGDLLQTADRLRLIQQCGAGLEGVDLEAASERGIHVANVPTDISGNADSVAELGIYFMIGLSRGVLNLGKSFREGKMGEPRGMALTGRTVGIVGLGGIGKALIKRLRPFDVRIIGLKRNEPEKARHEFGLDWVGGVEDLPELLRRSDFVVLCLPCNTESRLLMNRQSFSTMKPEAFLINLSRGGLVDRAALEDVLSTGRIAGAGLDVFWEEPPSPEDPIFQYNVMATPHIAGSTDHSMTGIVSAVAENIRRVACNKEPRFVKNA